MINKQKPRPPQLKEEEVLTHQVALNSIATLAPGAYVTWGSGGEKREGIVDFLHTDPDGSPWAFVSWGPNWAAVSLKILNGGAK